MNYICSGCKLSVIVLPTQVIKACKCNSAITAEIKASVNGNGGILKNKRIS